MRQREVGSRCWTRTSDQSVNSRDSDLAIPESYTPSWTTRGQRRTAVEVAREVLSAAAAARVSADLLKELASAVLEREDVRLALAVREGGEHRVRRAIELSGLLLVNSEVAHDAESKSASKTAFCVVLKALI